MKTEYGATGYRSAHALFAAQAAKNQREERNRASMKRLVFAALLAVVIAAVPFRGQSEKPLPNLASPVVAVAFQSNSACTPPTQMASSPEQTAWQIFVAATCPVNNNQYPYIVWENWIEQSQLYPGSPSAAASK